MLLLWHRRTLHLFTRYKCCLITFRAVDDWLDSGAGFWLHPPSQRWREVAPPGSRLVFCAFKSWRMWVEVRGTDNHASNKVPGFGLKALRLILQLLHVGWFWISRGHQMLEAWKSKALMHKQSAWGSGKKKSVASFVDDSASCQTFCFTNSSDIFLRLTSVWLRLDSNHSWYCDYVSGRFIWVLLLKLYFTSFTRMWP